MKKLVPLALFQIAMLPMLFLSGCGDSVEPVTVDYWQILYDYLVEQGPIEKEDEIRTFHLEAKDNDTILVGIFVEIDSLYASGNADFVLTLPHAEETVDCPIELSATYRYLGITAKESGKGSINRATYQDGTDFSWTSHKITEGVESSFTDDLSSQVISDIIVFLCSALTETELDISIADLGFLSYTVPTEDN